MPGTETGFKAIVRWVALVVAGVALAGCTLNRRPAPLDRAQDGALPTRPDGGDVEGGVCDCRAGCTDPRCDQRADGEACERDGDCQSRHCNQNICCSGGTCCTDTAMCPGGGGLGAVCEDNTTCQGSRGEVTCGDFRCGTVHGVPDDSACDSGLEAKACGRYRPVFCSGGTSQAPPQCPTSCASDEACDEGSQCVAARCQAIGANGEACAADGECLSDYCSGGFCCAAGDCCQTAADCPNSYGGPAVCESPSTCQGTRPQAACSTDFQCGSELVADDSACGTTVLANSCGDALDRFCSGEPDQPEAACSQGCATDEDCDRDAHCDTSGQCEPDLPDGSTCGRNAVCQGDRCVNGHCCDEGDCCAVAADCPEAVYVQRSCVMVQQCEGFRLDAVCDGSARCVRSDTPTPDDSACEGSRALSCGDFRDEFCTDAVDQTPACLVSCTDSDDCDLGAVCVEGDCVPI